MKYKNMKKVGRCRIQSGQSLFSYNYINDTLINMGRPRDVVVEKGVLYVIALNKKNAMKKIKNAIRGGQ